MHPQAIAFMLLTVFLASHLASPLSDIDEVRELLLEISGMDNEERDLDAAVMDIVEKVYSPARTSRLEARSEGQDCGDGWTASCKNNGCVNGKCDATCDSMKLGPDNQEKYHCQCDSGYTAVMCNVKKTTKKKMCESECHTAEHCYIMQQSKTGVFCYDKEWNLMNTDDVVSERSMREMSEMGMFADVVENIMRRQMSSADNN